MTAKTLLTYSYPLRDKILSQMSTPELDKLFKGTIRLCHVVGDDVQWFAVSQMRSQIVYWIQVKKFGLPVFPWFQKKLDSIKL